MYVTLYNSFKKNRLSISIKWLNENLHPAVVIFIVICLNRLHLPLSGGEEHYLSFALQHYDPQWIPNSFTYTEFPGTRLLFQVITGFFVERFGFMTIAIAGRLIVFTLISFPLTRLFRLFGFNNILILIIVQGFLLTSQSFFADEWILRTFEPKAPAYVFLFWGLLFLLSRQYLLMAIALAFSAWFHLLVGGWFMLGALCVMILQKKSFRQWFSAGALFALMMLPLLIYLWPVLAGQISNGESMNHVYVYFRLKHHLGLFDTYDYFVQKHLAGVIVALIVLLFQPYLYRRFADPLFRTLVLLNGVFLALAMVFVILAWVDMQFLNKSGGLGLTYYPFRMMSVSLLITIIQLTLFLREHLPAFKRVVMVLATSAVIVLLVRTFVNVKVLIDDLQPVPEIEEMYHVVNRVSKPGDVFVLLHPDYPTATSFSRLSRRENYVVYKYVPAGTWKLAEWYRRIGVVERMENEPSTIHTLASREGIRYVFSRYPITDQPLELCWKSSFYYLYQVLCVNPEMELEELQFPEKPLSNP